MQVMDSRGLRPPYRETGHKRIMCGNLTRLRGFALPLPVTVVHEPARVIPTVKLEGEKANG